MTDRNLQCIVNPPLPLGKLPRGGIRSGVAASLEAWSVLIFCYLVSVVASYMRGAQFASWT